MKKIFLAGFVLLTVISANAQVDTTATAPTPKRTGRQAIDLSNRAGDHFLIQIGYDSWANKPDSIHTKGFSRSLNMYLMFDFPFKTNPQFSVAIGAGIGSSNIFFDKQEVEVAGSSQSLAFPNRQDTNHFKKYKLVTAYLEAPVELRFTADPANYNKSFKVAIGGKIGTLLNVHTKGKNLLNKDGGTINSYTKKENSKRYFNGNRLMVTARVGYGSFSLFGAYQVNNFIKEGAGPDVRPYSIGLTISGL
ncbi:MAG TPA: outer membrane beta-barrel protein [Chitinophagaceae bacterium]|nr:outer membrane beta-barrel protein [Chitinophagaceae bacterium]